MEAEDLRGCLVSRLIKRGEGGAAIRQWFEGFDREFGPEWRDCFRQRSLSDHLASLGWTQSDVSCVEGLTEAIRDAYVASLRDLVARGALCAQLPAPFAEVVAAAEEDLVSVDVLLRIFQECDIQCPIYPAIPGAMNANMNLDQGLGAVRAATTCTVRVRPDLLRTMLKVEWIERRELELWNGRKFDARRLSALREVAEAAHGPGAGQRGWKTQFLWEPKGGMLQFAIEELPDPDNDERRVAESGGEIFVMTRFAHGMFNQTSGEFEHLDGHVHMYTLDCYKERQVRRLCAHYNDYEKYKVFSIDAVTPGAPGVPAKLGFDVACAFFRWNDMVPEYFGCAAPAAQ